MEDNELTSIIIECAIKVHKILGPGLLESAYKNCLHYELVKNELFVELKLKDGIKRVANGY